LQDLGRFEEALASYDKAIALKPRYPEAFYNRGNTLKDFDRCEEVLASYDSFRMRSRCYSILPWVRLMRIAAGASGDFLICYRVSDKPAAERL
jgi:tetratricopeptide (TPR) repeat protein